MYSKLKNCDSTVEAISAALREDANDNTEYDYVGSTLVKIRGNQQFHYNSSVIVEALQKYSSALPGTSPNAYRLAEELRRWALDQQSSRLVMLRGMSGAGKSDTFRSILQHFIYTDVMQGGINGIAEERDPSKPLGFYSNPMIISPDASTTVKKFYASLCLLQAFSSAATEKNPWSTRVGQYIQLHFSSQGRILDAVTIPVFTEMFRCNPKDPNVGPLYIQHLLVHARGKPEYLSLNSSFRDIYNHYKDISYDAELMHLHKILVHWGGLHEDQWEELLKVVASVVHLQNINILGSETAMISANTKHHIQTAEQLLGLEQGSLLPTIMKKVDDRPSRPVGSTMECRPHESKIILDLLCNELMVRVLTSCLNQLRTNNQVTSMVNFFDGKAPQDGSLHIYDPPGWDRYMPQTPGNFYQFLNHYVEEKYNSFAIQEQFLSELYAYQDEGIQLDLIANPNISQYIDLLELSPGGLISLLEDAGSAQKPDDKAFADKAIMNYGRVKLIRAGGAKTKPTTFVVRHSFGEAAYDCDGFIFCNKLSEPSPVITNCLKTSTISYLQTPSQYAPLLSPTAVAPPPPKEGAANRLTKAKITLLYTKFLQMTDKLLGYLASCEKKNFVLCVNASNAIDDNLLAGQVQSLLMPNLIELSRFGFGYRLQFVEFFQRYRILAKFEHSILPVALSTSVIHDANRMRSYSQALMDEVIAIIARIGMTDMDLSQGSAGLAVYGRTSIFIKDSFAELMERARFAYFERYTAAAVRLQSFVRMRHWHQEYSLVRNGVIVLQSLVRRQQQRKLFLITFRAAMLLKGWFLTRRAAKKYQRMRVAVNLIKSKLLGKMVQRIRYQRLIRAARTFQHLARGSLLRRAALNVFDAVVLLQRTFRALLMRRRRRRQRREAILRIQRVFRGHRARAKLGNLVQILKIRREQRVANQVVQKIQSIWRGKLVIARFQELVAATIVLQRWFKACVHYNRFQKIRALAIWLQSQARRLIAAKRTNAIKVGNMVKEEKGTLASLYLQEISIIRHPRHTILTKGFTNHGRDRFERDLLMYDVSFDLTIAYPDGWLPTILSFVQDLRIRENRLIEHLVVGGQHTVFVDDSYQVYTMGLGDLGQLGHNSRKSFPTPKKIEQIQRFITQGESLEKVKAGTLSASKLSTQVVPKMGILSIACGQDHTLLLTQTKKIFSWGDNRRGQLGHSNFEISAIPRLVTYTHSVNKAQVPLQNVKSIFSGKYHSACLAENGLVYVWGSGEVCMGVDRSIVLDDWENVDFYGIIDTYYKDINCRYDPSGVTGSGPRHVIDFCEPRAVSVLNKRKIFAVASGEMHIAVIANDGVYTWGNNTYGQLGLGHTKDTYIVSKVSFQHMHSSHVSSGHNAVKPGTLSSQTANNNANAHKEFSERDLMHMELMTGGRHMFLRTKSGVLWGWGWNKYGQVGDGSVENVLRPIVVAIKDAVGNKASAPLTNNSHTVASPAKDNTHGGSNMTNMDQAAIALTLGWRSSMAVTKQGQVFGWGIISSLAAAVEINLAQEMNGMRYEDPSALFLVPTLLPLSCSPHQVQAMGNKHSCGNGLHSTSGFALSLFMLDRVLSRDATTVMGQQQQQQQQQADDDRSILQHSVVSMSAASSSASVSAPGKTRKPLSTGVFESKPAWNQEEEHKQKAQHRTVKLDIMRAAKAAKERKERESNVRYDTKTGSQKNNTKVADEVLQRFRNEVGRLSLYPGSTTTTNKRNTVTTHQHQQQDTHGTHLGMTTMTPNHDTHHHLQSLTHGKVSPRVGGGGATMRTLTMMAGVSSGRVSPGRTYTRQGAGQSSPGRLHLHDLSLLSGGEDAQDASVGADSSTPQDEEETKRKILQEQQAKLQQPGALLELFSPMHYSKIKQRRKDRGSYQPPPGVGIQVTSGMHHHHHHPATTSGDEVATTSGMMMLAMHSQSAGHLLRSSGPSTTTTHVSPGRFTQSLASASHHHIAPVSSLASSSTYSPGGPQHGAHGNAKSPLLYLNQRHASPTSSNQGQQPQEVVQRIVAYEVPIGSPPNMSKDKDKDTLMSSPVPPKQGSRHAPAATQRSDMMFLQSFLQKTASSNTARSLQQRHGGGSGGGGGGHSSPSHHTATPSSTAATAAATNTRKTLSIETTTTTTAAAAASVMSTSTSRRLSALTSPLQAQGRLSVSHPAETPTGRSTTAALGGLLGSTSTPGDPGEFRRQMQELGYLKRSDKPRTSTPTGLRTPLSTK